MTTSLAPLSPEGRGADERWFDRILRRYCLILECVIAAGLAVMVVLVFGNVLLRYAFDSGIAVSEEMSRWLFVWVTFLGAVIALREHAHLGTDMLLARLSLRARKACVALGYLLMIYTCWLLLRGSWSQVQINADVTAPSSGASMAIFYGAGVVFAVSALLMLVAELFKLLTGTSRTPLIATDAEATP